MDEILRSQANEYAICKVIRDTALRDAIESEPLSEYQKNEYAIITKTEKQNTFETEYKKRTDRLYKLLNNAANYKIIQ